MSITTIADLTPDPNNARRHNPRNIGMIERSLNEVGAGRSIVIDEHSVILAGNGLVEAAAQAGIERVRVVDADGDEIIAVRRKNLTPEQKVKLALFDNRTNELSDWEPAVLADIAKDVDLSSLFTDVEWADVAMPALPEAGGGGDEFDTTPEQGETRTQLGQLWSIGGVHRLLVGDCTVAENVARLMGNQRAAAMVSDSPYGISQDGIENDDPEGLQALFDGMLAALPMDSGVVVNFQSTRLFPVWLDALRAAGQKFERMLWMYKAAQNTYPWRGWLLKSEAILVSTKGAGAWNDHHPYAHDCYYLSEVSGEIPEGLGWHASVKPMSVVTDLAQRVSSTGDIVYDPFLGSGTGIIAAHRTGRRCYGMEISPRYADVILRRAEAEGLECTLIDA